MTIQDAEQLRDAVRDHYGKAAESATACCSTTPVDLVAFGSGLYDSSERDALPEAAVLASMGCGNPTALADLRPGEVVLDLGSGGGIDVLLSARRVGPTGRAYGLDMTPQMHELATRNRDEAGVTNAEFLLGTIEDVPLPDGAVDVIISNCVVNLSADKPQVLREAFRVLAPGGRLAISDVVLRRALPAPLQHVVGLWTGCIAGALEEGVLRAELAAAGFVDVDIEVVQAYDRSELEQMAREIPPGEVPEGLDVEATVEALDGVITSSFVRARKPAGD